MRNRCTIALAHPSTVAMASQAMVVDCMILIPLSNGPVMKTRSLVSLGARGSFSQAAHYTMTLTWDMVTIILGAFLCIDI